MVEREEPREVEVEGALMADRGAGRGDLGLLEDTLGATGADLTEGEGESAVEAS